MKSAFTLIELMVVISIGALIAVLTIPSYISFNRSQEVKQAAGFLKSNLRDAQNRSFAGEKHNLCTPSNILEGLFAEFWVNGTTFNIKGLCGLITPSPASSYIKKLPANITVKSLLNVSGTTCASLGSPLRVLFKPIGKGTNFYNVNVALSGGLSSPISGVSKVAIELKHSAGNLYYVIITSGGEIYESATCP